MQSTSWETLGWKKHKLESRLLEEISITSDMQGYAGRRQWQPSTLAWKIPWTEEPGRLQSMGSWRVGHDWATSLSLFTFMHWRRKWQTTPVFLPGESQGRGSLVGCHLWGRTELDMTEATQQQQQQICRWHHPYSRKWGGTKEPLDESERGECQSWLKAEWTFRKLRSWHPVPSLHGK